MYSPGYFLSDTHILVGINLHIWIRIARNLFFKHLFVTFLFFFFVLVCCWLPAHFQGKKFKGVFSPQNAFFFFFSSAYVGLNVVVIIFGVFVPVQSINTSGMSITLLMEQNVYRYYALADHALSLLFTRHRVFSVSRVTLF